MAMAMVVMKGHPGSGKSSLARIVGAALKWPVIDKDDIRDSTRELQETLILQVAAGRDQTKKKEAADMAKEEEKERLKLLNSMAYEAMWRVAETQIAMGISVIVDSPLSRPSLLRSALAIAHRHGARLLLVECVASDSSVWRSRLESRHGSSESWHKPSRWEDLQVLLNSYHGCWDYSFSIASDTVDKELSLASAAARKLVVDTTSADLSLLRDSVLCWISSIADDTPILSFAEPSAQQTQSHRSS